MSYNCGYLLLCVCVCVCALNHFSQVWLFGILWTVASQASLSMGFSWWEYWRGLPFPTPEGLPDSRIEPVSLTSPALAGRFFTTRATWEVQAISYRHSDVNARWSPDPTTPGPPRSVAFVNRLVINFEGCHFESRA